MNVRRSWYIVSHRYKKDSYARMALDRLYSDYKDFFMARVTVSDYEKWTMHNKSSISWIAIRPMYMMMNCVST